MIRIRILELDLAVRKTFAFTDRYKLDFRMDFFNFINRANFGFPVRYLEAPSFGQATGYCHTRTPHSILAKVHFLKRRADEGHPLP